MTSSISRAEVILRHVRVLEWAHHLLDFCYPGICAACESSCAGAVPLCETCLDDLSKLESAPACAACAAPLARAGDPCPFCQDKGVPHYDRIVRLGVFDDPLKSMIHQIKYHGRWGLAEYLAEQLWRLTRVRSLLIESDCIVAIPLHPLRQIHRGYNQAQLIARRLARRSGRKLVHPIIRIRNTASQTRLRSRAKRDENLKDAFGLMNSRCIRDRRVIVIDDVTTSGATLQSVARTLREAHPAGLNAVVVAIADPRHYDFQMI